MLSLTEYGVKGWFNIITWMQLSSKFKVNCGTDGFGIVWPEAEPTIIMLHNAKIATIPEAHILYMPAIPNFDWKQRELKPSCPEFLTKTSQDLLTKGFDAILRSKIVG